SAMCGRFTNQYTWRELHALYMLSIGFSENEQWAPKFNIAPTDPIPVILNENGVRKCELMRWGLIPSWAKEIGNFSTFNARRRDQIQAALPWRLASGPALHRSGFELLRMEETRAPAFCHRARQQGANGVRRTLGRAAPAGRQAHALGHHHHLHT